MSILPCYRHLIKGVVYKLMCKPAFMCKYCSFSIMLLYFFALYCSCVLSYPLLPHFLFCSHILYHTFFYSSLFWVLSYYPVCVCVFFLSLSLSQFLAVVCNLVVVYAYKIQFSDLWMQQSAILKKIKRGNKKKYTSRLYVCVYRVHSVYSYIQNANAWLLFVDSMSKYHVLL